MSDDATGYEVARITITRTMSADDIIDNVEASDANGNELGIAEALGMMELAKFSLIQGIYEADEEGDL